MMEMKNNLREFLTENFMVELDSAFTEDDSLLEYGVIDSTGVLELVIYLEEKYNIKIEDDEIIPENLDSLNNIDKYIKSKINH